MSPNVLAVGGTSLELSGSGGISSETVWNNEETGSSFRATGGGVSSYESRRAYQNGVASVVGSTRGTPDLSFDADPSTGVVIYDSYNGGSSTPWEEIGGTSLSATAWAGLIAMRTKAGSPTGAAPLMAPARHYR